MISPFLLALSLLASGQPAADNGVYAMVTGPKGPVRVSLFSEEDASMPVAQVEDRVVTLRELSSALAAVHGAHKEGEKAGKKDFRPVLDRLIGARLVSLEAHEMGIDDLPEVKKAMDAYARSALREVLQQRLTRDVKADPNAVESYFRDAVREWKLKSVLFAKEADAREMSAAVKAGKTFDALAAQAVAAKKAQSGAADGYFGAKAMQPQVAAAAQGLFAGQASDPVQVDEGWAVFKIEDIRYPDNPQARAEAEARALDEAREKRLRTAYDGFVKQYAKVNDKLLEKLDFEAKKPGFARLEKDKRVIARVEGGIDITVSDLAQVLRTNFFHGIEEAIRLKRVNSFRYGTFNKMLYRDIFDAVAAKEKIAESAEYTTAVADYRDSLIFGEFVKRSVMNDVKVTEEEGRKYYDDHKAEFTIPALYTLDSLSFTSAHATEAALDRLKAGTDFKWLKSNSDGQVPADDRNLDLGNGTVSGRSLPDGLSAKLSGSKPGDVRIFTQDRQHHLILIKGVTAEKERPYLEVRADIGKKLTGQKLNQALQELIAKLRKAHDVKVYLTQIGS